MKHSIYFSINSKFLNKILKVPGPIASDFSHTFGDFGIRRKLMFFSSLLVNFTAEKCTVWKIFSENVTSNGNHN